MFVKNLVYGHSLQAVVFASKNEYDLVLSSPEQPYFFQNQAETWFKTVFELSLAGKIPFGIARNIRISDSTAKIVAGNGSVHSVVFNRVHVFSDKNLICDNNTIRRVSRKNLVVDWIRTRHMGEHSSDSIYSADDFVHEIHFFKPDRVSTAAHRDMAVVSYLSDEELSTFEYSDTMVRFKLEFLLKSHVLGAKNGLDNLGNPRYHKPKLYPYQRDVREQSSVLYEDSESVIYYNNDRTGQ